MDWQIDKKRAICPQICEQLSVMISKGQFKPDEKLLSVRDVAVSAGVNPNTVQKSFEQLEEIGLIYSVRGSGWYVAPNIESAKAKVKEILISKTTNFINEMKQFDLSNEMILDLVKENIDGKIIGM